MSAVGRGRHLVPAAVAALALVAAGTGASALTAPLPRVAGTPLTTGLVGPAVTVGTAGNEPNLAVAPDGTAYISALNHLYVTHDRGATWQPVPAQLENGQGNLVSDSSVSVDPGGRLFFTVNYPYAGIVAVCTSDDRGASLQCNPSTVPGGNDRQWLTAAGGGASYLTTNSGLYETNFLTSSDRGATYVPKATTDSPLNPNDGPPVPRPKDGLVYQPFVNASTNQTALDNELSGPLQLHVWDPASLVPTPKAELDTPLLAGAAINDLVTTPDGTLYLASEGVSGTDGQGQPTGKDVRVARSTDAGKTWTVLPPLPGTSTGTSGFAWIAAGSDGHLGVVYYRTPAGGRADSATGVWDTFWAETRDAADAAPAWRTQALDAAVHTGHLCTTAGCMGSDRFAGDFLGAAFDSSDRASVTWMRQLSNGSTQVRFAGPVGADAEQPGSTVPESGVPVALPLGAAAVLAVALRRQSRRRTRRN